jgi:hypothetical protein
MWETPQDENPSDRFIYGQTETINLFNRDHLDSVYRDTLECLESPAKATS